MAAPTVPLDKLGHGLKVFKNNPASTSDTAFQILTEATNAYVEMKSDTGSLRMTWNDGVNGERVMFDQTNLSVDISTGPVGGHGIKYDVFESLQILHDAIQALDTGSSTDISGLQAQIDSNVQDIDNLTTRVTVTEGEVDALQTLTNGIQETNNLQDTTIQNLDAAYKLADTNLQSEIDALDGSLIALDARVGTAEGEIDTLQTLTDGHTTQLTTQGDAITQLETTVANLQAQIDFHHAVDPPTGR